MENKRVGKIMNAILVSLLLLYLLNYIRIRKPRLQISIKEA